MWLFYGLPVLAVFLMGVVHAYETLGKIRLHWNEYRCNPIYIPFAGMVRPDIGVESNFQFCMNQFAQHIFKFFIDELMSLFKTLTSSMSSMGGSLPAIRSVMSGIRKTMLSFGAQTFGKITTSMGSMTYILIKIRDIMKRFAGTGYIGAFLVKTMMDFIYGFVMLIIAIIKGFVYALLAISIILALFQPEMLILAIVLASLIAASGF